MTMSAYSTVTDGDIQVAYDSDTSTLRVKYASGAVYEYPGVPSGIYTAMTGGSSLGGTFGILLRTQYGGTLVTPATEHGESN